MIFGNNQDMGTLKAQQSSPGKLILLGHFSPSNNIINNNKAVEVQDRISGDNQVVKVQGKATDNKALVQGGTELVPVLDLSLDSDQVIEDGDVSPQKKRMKLIDTEHIIMGKELTDTEINLA